MLSIVIWAIRWMSRASEAQRPEGRGFPVRYFSYGCIVPLDPALKGRVYGALAGRLDDPVISSGLGILVHFVA